MHRKHHTRIEREKAKTCRESERGRERRKQRKKERTLAQPWDVKYKDPRALCARIIFLSVLFAVLVSFSVCSC